MSIEPTTIDGNTFTFEITTLNHVLVYADDETIANLLGITEDMYEVAEIADQWKLNLVEKIHPDNCKHPLAAEAMCKVNSMYEGMEKHAK